MCSLQADISVPRKVINRIYVPPKVAAPFFELIAALSEELGLVAEHNQAAAGNLERDLVSFSRTESCQVYSLDFCAKLGRHVLYTGSIFQESALLGLGESVSTGSGVDMLKRCQWGVVLGLVKNREKVRKRVFCVWVGSEQGDRAVASRFCRNIGRSWGCHVERGCLLQSSFSRIYSRPQERTAWHAILRDRCFVKQACAKLYAHHTIDSGA